ncbi:transcriptional regulator FeaR [Lampropedia cohaerens]|uniref:transcriptional regulator FeaR n=1 Tax=Lampropedia cohaerens TaxID=1610491 RepID=UPI000699C0BD|nr:transcriptional regulator FeaR [Lampropedia cohaerens]
MSNAHCLDQWEVDVQRICGGFRISPPADQRPFAGSIHAAVWSGLTVANIRTNAANIWRTREGRQDDRFCFLVLQRRGVMSVLNGQQDFALRPGDMALLDSCAQLQMRPHGFIEQISVHLPRTLMSQTGQSTIAGKLSLRSPCTPMLREMLHQLQSQPLAYGSAQVADSQAIQTAMLTLLRRARDASAEQSLDSSPHGQRVLAERFIAQNLSEPGLSPTHVAHYLGISLRQLYRLFDKEENGIARYITNMRLARSEQDLRDRSSNRLSITDIAHKWGFFDSAQYCRAFKRRYELSPRQFRLQDDRVV